jgi:hypothetical protein
VNKEIDEVKKKIKEAQNIILKAFSLNGIETEIGLMAIFATGMAIMKHDEISNEEFEKFAKGLIEAYREFKKK